MKFIHLQLRGIIWHKRDLHGGSKMKAERPERIHTFSKCISLKIEFKAMGLKWLLKFENVFPSNFSNWNPQGALHMCLRNFVRLSKRKMGKMHLGGVPPWCHRFFAQNGRQFCCEPQIGHARLQILPSSKWKYKYEYTSKYCTIQIPPLVLRLEFPAWNWSHEIAKGKTVSARKLKAPLFF